MVLESLTNLSKELHFYDKQFKALRKLKSSIAEIDQIKRGVSTATSSVKTLEKQFGAGQKVVDVLNKDVKESKNLWNSFLSKIPGGGNNASKASKVGATIGGLIALGGVAVIIALQSIVAGIVQNSADKRSDTLDAELTKVNGRALQAQAQVKAVLQQLNQNKLEDQRTRDRVYGLEKQLVPIREKSNDALYEVRQGRTILESKIADARKYANDVLAESRGTASKINSQIQQQNASFAKQIADVNAKIASFTNGVKDNFQTSINTTINGLKAEITSLKATQATKVDINSAIDKNNVAIDSKLKSTNDVLQGIIKPVQATVNTLQNGYTEIVKNGVTTRYFDGVVKSLQDTYSKSFEAQGAKWNEEQRKLSEDFLNQIKQGNATSNIIQQGIREVDKQVNDFIREVERKTSLIDTVKPDIDKLRKDVQGDLNKDNNRLTTLEIKIQEIEKMNEKGNQKLDQIIPKLDQIIPTLAGIPLIPGRVADTLKPSIPTLPQIENSVGTAMCKNLRTGCGKQAIDNAVGNITGNNNNNTNALLNAVNTGLNAGTLASNLALLPTINNKLGEQIPGGISGKLGKIASWLQLDRVLNLLITAATIHNAFQLSNDIAVTLGSALGNILQLIGIKNDEGGAIDIGQLINGTVENLVKGVIGAENYKEMSLAFAKANRIYQASSNVLNSFTNIGHTITNGLEIVGGQNGKIGNALKTWGIVGEKAYEWMNPNPNYHSRMLNFFQNAQQGASTIQQVTQVPLDIIQAATEFNNSTTEVIKAVTQDENTKDGANVGDAKKVKESQQIAKTSSIGASITKDDLFNANS
ncbi:hypothetical protein FD725_26635 [Nostoc sp. TCL26-01]|nr:hypothetical protein FD725_04490 [Nostoc sp. TCL26-01]QLE58765.1 hypothetical protein FD725_26635 [Nostoc sp. TCL26-01]